jgi:hypothetical protein
MAQDARLCTTAEVVEEERRPGSTTEILSAATVHSAEEGAVLAAEAASVQKKGTEIPVLATDEVQPPTEGEENVMETVGAPKLGAPEAAATIAQGQEATQRVEIPMVAKIDESPVNGHQVDTVPVSQPSSPASIAATAVTTGGVKEKRQMPSTRADAEEIMPMLEQAMVKVCKWSEQIEAQTMATVEHDVGA